MTPENESGAGSGEDVDDRPAGQAAIGRRALGSAGGGTDRLGGRLGLRRLAGGGGQDGNQRLRLHLRRLDAGEGGLLLALSGGNLGGGGTERGDIHDRGPACLGDDIEQRLGL